MKVLGVVTEYNPFHNGHLYHIQESKRLTGCDYVISVMSGHFIQRGQPALLNKWARAKMALLNGVDLIIELPVYYSLSSAEFFAYGAVKILDSTQIVDFIGFGSESGNLKVLKEIAAVLSNESDQFRLILSDKLKSGCSFPKARAQALCDFFSDSGLNNTDIIEAISQPNNILGIEYLKALLKINSKIEPFTIKRTGIGYNSNEAEGRIASATAIRNLLKQNRVNEIKKLMPYNAYEILKTEIDDGRAPIFSEAFETVILSDLRKLSPEALRKLSDVNEGIENRIIKASQISGSIEELINNIKTKRYTQTHIQRILFSLLLNLEKNQLDLFNRNGGPQYIRILGFNSKGKELLGKIKSSLLPIFTAPHDFLRDCSDIQKAMLEADISASDIFSLGYPEPNQRKSRQDFYQQVISIKT